MTQIMQCLLALQRLELETKPLTLEHEGEILKLREKVPVLILGHFNRLIARGKRGVAIARDGVCSECHLRITSGTLAGLVYATEIHRCDNCGRYLYLPENEPLGLADPPGPPKAPVKSPARRTEGKNGHARPATVMSPNRTMTLADLTSPGLIIPHLRGEDVAAVIQELSQALQRERRVPDLLPFYHAALNREFLVSSDWEAGMAFPHARLPGLKELSFALGRCDQPLDWGAKAGHSVRWIFLIAVPATESTQYLSLISGLARLAKDGRLVEKLRAAEDAIEMFGVLQQIELRTNPKRTR